MPRSRSDLVLLGLMTALLGGLVWAVSGYLHAYQIAEGDAAPAFNVRDESGAGLRLEDFEGKVVLLNIWATWCPPCIDELPSLVQLHEQLDEKGFVVVGVSVDRDAEQYKQFLQTFNVPFPTARDENRAVAMRYGTMKFPESYLISRDGRVLRKYEGAVNWVGPEVYNYIESIL